ncbi:hypothetical protein ANN_06642 [Periplaneta americana]|uniref:Uncharacterized protein n=1 Tax=Periplaneta americana TaxID=6978 RepID=A0ABQ8TG51_PERAM|nr:hypothetical protein ANN_06642 [Periplaneta americana]
MGVSRASFTTLSSPITKSDLICRTLQRNSPSMAPNRDGGSMFTVSHRFDISITTVEKKCYCTKEVNLKEISFITTVTNRGVEYIVKNNFKYRKQRKMSTYGEYFGDARKEMYRNFTD